MWTTDMKVLFKSNKAMSKYGLDHQAVHGIIAWLMQLYRIGIITAKDTDGIPMERGSEKAIMATIEKMAKNEGFGALINTGASALGKKIGKNSEYYLMHKRDTILSASHDWRMDATRTLGGATSNRDETQGGVAHGAAIWTSYYKDQEKTLKWSKKTYGTEKTGIPWELEGKAAWLKDSNRREAYTDSLPYCAFARSKVLRWELVDSAFDIEKMMVDIYSAVTGVNLSVAELLKVGDLVINLEKAINLKQGHKGRIDDTVPKRMYQEAIPDGYHKGRILDEKQVEKAKGEYYAVSGWDVETGLPTRKKLEELGLKDVANDLEKLGKLSKKLPKQKIS